MKEVYLVESLGFLKIGSFLSPQKVFLKVQGLV